MSQLTNKQNRGCLIAFCVIFWTCLIAAVILVVFLVRAPSVTVTRVTVQCSSFAACQADAASGGVPVQVTFAVDNPDIISSTISSDDLVLTDPSNNVQMATGSIPSTHIGSSGTTDVPVLLTFPADSETVRFILAIYSGSAYPINVNGHMHVSLGALSLSVVLDQTVTVAAQS